MYDDSMSFDGHKKSFLDRSFEAELLNNPIHQYNYFIKCYNTPENQVEGIKLEEIKISKVYDTFWSIISNKIYLVLLIFLVSVPVLGLLVYGWIFIAITAYFGGMALYDKNAEKVSDPFQSMVFSPELCRISKMNRKFYEIQIQELEGFSFNTEVISNLKGKGTHGKIKFMVYNSIFEGYYNNYAKLRLRHVLFLLMSTFCLMVQVFTVFHVLTYLGLH